MNASNDSIAICLSDEEYRFFDMYRRNPEWGKRRIEFLLSFLSRVVLPTDPRELLADITDLFVNAPSHKRLSALKRECWQLVARHRAR